MKHQEHILAVPAACFASTAKGFGLEVTDIKPEHLVLMQRKGLETNPLYRQLISYSVVYCDGKVLAYRRTPEGNEARLHGKVSIGFGGHVDMEDVAFVDGVIDFEETANIATRREISEEVMLGKIENIRRLDHYIVSSANDTDRVHAGMLSVVDTAEEYAVSKEDQIEILGWFKPVELIALHGEEIESWSMGLLANSKMLNEMSAFKTSFQGNGASHAFSR